MVVVDASLEYRPLTVQEFREHGQALMRANFEEMETSPARRVLDVNWEVLQLIENQDRSISFGVWDESCLAGYLSALHNPGSLHHAGWPHAEVCVIYVSPEYRNLRVLTELMGHFRRECRQRGLRSVLWKAKDASPFHRFLDKKTQFCLLEHTYEEVV